MRAFESDEGNPLVEVLDQVGIRIKFQQSLLELQLQLREVVFLVRSIIVFELQRPFTTRGIQMRLQVDRYAATNDFEYPGSSLFCERKTK